MMQGWHVHRAKTQWGTGANGDTVWLSIKGDGLSATGTTVGTANTSGNIVLSGSVNVRGELSAAGGLTVGGYLTVNSALNINGNIEMGAAYVARLG